jgi:hypothetical protein
MEGMGHSWCSNPGLLFWPHRIRTIAGLSRKRSGVCGRSECR